MTDESGMTGSLICRSDDQKAENVMKSKRVVSVNGKKRINHRRRQMIFRRISLFATIILSVVMIITVSGMTSHAQDSKAVQYYKYYTSVIVMPGDTLSSIADAYPDNYSSVSAHIGEIMTCNHLTDDVIYPGTYLIVPYYSPDFVK